MGRRGVGSRSEPRWVWDAKRFATRRSCLPPEEWLAKSRSRASHQLSQGCEGPRLNATERAPPPRGLVPEAVPLLPSPVPITEGQERGKYNISQRDNEFGRVPGGRVGPGTGPSHPRARAGPLGRRSHMSWLRRGGDLFADCSPCAVLDSDDEEVLQEPRETIEEDVEWLNG